MRAALVRGLNDVYVDDIPAPTIRDDEALVRIRSVGICGSDIHYYSRGRIGRFVVTPPFILGHECAGEVVEVGQTVTNVKVGDRVAVEPGVPCRGCGYCKQGRYNLCRDVVFLATPPVQGALVEYLAHPSDFLYRLPDEVSLHEGALCEPLSTGMQAVRRAKPSLGDRVFIAGVGPIGLMALQAFRAAGAGAIYVSDLDRTRLDLALKLGATAAFDASDPDLLASVRDLADGIGPEIVVETAGSEEATTGSVELVRAGGVVVLVGLVPSATVPFPAPAIVDKELDVRGVFRYANTYPAALEMIRQGRVDVKGMITGEYPLERANDALSDVARRAPGTIKAMVVNEG